MYRVYTIKNLPWKLDRDERLASFAALQLKTTARTTNKITANLLIMMIFGLISTFSDQASVVEW